MAAVSWHLHDPGLWLTLGAWVAGAIGAWLVVRGVRGIRLGVTACRSCGYDTSGVVADKCPECGKYPKQGQVRRWAFWSWLAGAVAMVGLSAAQKWWVGPLADVIWAGLPRRVLVESFNVEGLSWRVYTGRGERTEPKTAGQLWDQEARIHHPLLGWVTVNLPEEYTSLPDGDPVDVTGDGVAEQFVRTWSGGIRCCQTLYVINRASADWAVVAIEGERSPPTFVDVDGDSVPEIQVEEWAFVEWEATFGESRVPQVILTMQDGALRPLTSAMRRPRRESLTRPEDQSVWSFVLELMYEGNEKQAWEYFDRVWPSVDADAKQQARATFLGQLESSKWWPMLRDAYAAEGR
jgi:ribosomal protein L37E